MIKVMPIKDAETLADIQKALCELTTERGRRMYLLFMTGIYTGLRIGDMVHLTVANVNGQYIVLREQKTQKDTEVIIPDELRAVYNDRLAGMPGSAYLFTSRKGRPDGGEKPISTRTAEKDMHWIKQHFGIKLPFNCHSLRKTFGYWHYQKYHDIEALRYRFNHSDSSVTRRYICVEQEEVNRQAKGLYFGFSHPKPEGYTPKRDKYGEPLTVQHLDRKKQGQIRGRRAQERRKNEARKKYDT